MVDCLIRLIERHSKNFMTRRNESSLYPSYEHFCFMEEKTMNWTIIKLCRPCANTELSNLKITDRNSGFSLKQTFFDSIKRTKDEKNQ